METRAPRRDKRQIVHFEDFASRECRYFLDRQGLPPCRCTHPENEEREVHQFDPGPLHVEIGACYIFACPLGACLNPESEPEDRRIMWRSGFGSIEGCSDETWMLTTVGDIRSATRSR